MALKKAEIKKVFGEELIFEDAYHKIGMVFGDKTNLTIQVLTYKDDTKVIKINERSYEFVPSADETSQRWDRQVYNYLKTLDEFVGAIDC